MLTRPSSPQVGCLPLDAARVLVERGTRPDERGGLTWSADPNLLLPSKTRFEEGSIQAMIRSIKVLLLACLSAGSRF